MIPIVSGTPLRDCARATRWTLIALVALAASGCASQNTLSWRSFGVYKIDINQGNYLSQDMIEKLKVGMTQQQVKQVLGTPLIASPFRPDRWDYVYEFTKQGQVLEHRNFSVYFTDGKLARWEGDEMPQSIVELNRSASAKALPSNAPGEKTFWDRFLDVFRQ